MQHLPLLLFTHITHKHNPYAHNNHTQLDWVRSYLCHVFFCTRNCLFILLKEPSVRRSRHNLNQSKHCWLFFFTTWFDYNQTWTEIKQHRNAARCSKKHQRKKNRWEAPPGGVLECWKTKHSKSKWDREEKDVWLWVCPSRKATVSLCQQHN